MYIKRSLVKAGKKSQLALHIGTKLNYTKLVRRETERSTRDQSQTGVETESRKQCSQHCMRLINDTNLVKRATSNEPLETRAEQEKNQNIPQTTMQGEGRVKKWWDGKKGGIKKAG